MNCISWDDLMGDRDLVREGGYAASIGVFDGVHRGHQVLVHRVVREGEGKSLIITFSKSPQEVLRPQTFSGYLFSLRQRLEVFADLGISLVCLIDFSQQFGTLSGKDFINLIQDRFKLRYLTLGSNFRCGHGLDTDSARIADLCEIYGIRCEIIEPLSLGGSLVSSSRIRNALALGDLVEVQDLSGRDIVFDLAGLTSTPGPAYFDYHVLPLRRVVPPPGRYEVTYLFNDLSECEGTVDIVPGIFRCSHPHVERLHLRAPKEFF